MCFMDWLCKWAHRWRRSNCRDRRECKIGKRKYHKGRLVAGQWIFGGIERNTNRLFVVPVENRSSNTLLGVIQKWIKPGSTVVSDCWRAYDCLEQKGYRHAMVIINTHKYNNININNHKYNFVDPASGAHTQNIERVWREIRDNIPRYGRRKHHYISYFAEYMFKRRYPYLQRIDAFFTIMRDLYPAQI